MNLVNTQLIVIAQFDLATIRCILLECFSRLAPELLASLVREGWLLECIP